MSRVQEPNRACPREERGTGQGLEPFHPQRRLPLPGYCELPAAPCRWLWTGLADVEAAGGLRFSLCRASQARSRLRCPGNSQEVTTKGSAETSLTVGLLKFLFSILAVSFKIEKKASYTLAPSCYSSHASIALSPCLPTELCLVVVFKANSWCHVIPSINT